MFNKEMARMKKRIYALILAVSFVFCCMVLPINAERVPTLTIESKKVKIGGEVEVALSIDGNPGIAGIVAELKYDKTAMTLVSMNAKADFGGTFVGDASQGSGFSWVSAADIKTDGVFATFKFRINDDATPGKYGIELEIGDGNTSNSAGDDVKFSVVNGSLSVIKFMPGDINDDEKVNVKDLVAFAQYLAKWDVKVNELALDVNCDGKVNVKDIVRLAQYLAGWDVSIGEPEVKPSEGLEFTLNYDRQSYSVAGIGSCTDTNVIIPSTYNNLPVTSIGYQAFSGCTSLTSVTIPEGVTGIDSYAFDGCSSLTRITIPNGITSIGQRAFYDTAYYNNKANWTDGVLYIGNHLIEADRNKLATDYTIRAGTKCIGGVAFNQCHDLKSVTIPEGVTSINRGAFFRCYALTNVTIPSSVTNIERTPFWYCTGITSITVAAGNPVYHSASNCLIETASKTLIAGCNSSVIPTDGSVTSIDYGAFDGYSKLTNITIPAEVTVIGGAFSGCSGLESITVEKGNKYYYSAGNCLIETASKTLIAGCKNSVIPTDGSVTSIGWAAFSGCSGVTSITIPSSVASIGGSAFSGCSSLTSITIPNGVTSIGYGAFSGCSSLTGITIPSSVTSIGEQAFRECSSLTSITIPSSVTSIGRIAFYQCGGLKSITVEKGNKYYHSAGNCLIETASKTLIAGSNSSIIPTDGSVTSIGDSAFWGCRSLTSITIPNGVTSIGDSAFLGCSGLTRITIPDGITSIEHQMFHSCSNLTSITIPSSVTSIGDYAFRYCNNLKIITFRGTEAQWNAITKGTDWDSGAGLKTSARKYTVVFAPEGSALGLYNKIWGTYTDDEKFPSGGGDVDHNSDEGPGAFDIEKNKESIQVNTHITDELLGTVTNDAATLMHMMNTNTFSSAIFHLKDASTAESFAKEYEKAVQNTRWMCGFPERVVVLSVGEYVAVAFGHEDLTSTFKTKCLAVDSSAKLLIDNAIDA